MVKLFKKSIINDAEITMSLFNSEWLKNSHCEPQFLIGAKQSVLILEKNFSDSIVKDCFVVSLLAMTNDEKLPVIAKPDFLIGAKQSFLLK